MRHPTEKDIQVRMNPVLEEVSKCFKKRGWNEFLFIKKPYQEIRG